MRSEPDATNVFRRVLSSLFIMVLSVALGACGVHQGSSQWVTASEATAQYRDEARQLRLAPGWDWPSDLGYEDFVEGDRVMHEANLGRADAAWYWHCSWARRFLNPISPTDQAASLSEVLKLRTSAYYKWGLDDVERRRRDKILDDAVAGDTKMFKRIIDLNCPERSK
jgi:hypothetical protein